MAVVRIHKAESVEAFWAIDLDNAESAAGIVRQARKILQGGAKDLARSLTYGFASFEHQLSGASAGISADGDARAEAVTGFVGESRDRIVDGSFLPDPGKGIAESDLAPLRDGDPRNPIRLQETDGVSLQVELQALGAVAGAQTVLGDLDGRSVAIESMAANGPAILRAVAAQGANVTRVGTTKGAFDCTAVDLDELAATHLAGGDSALAGLDGLRPLDSAVAGPVDALFVGTKMGSIDHVAADTIEAGVVVPAAPLPVTTKALAVLRRAEVPVLPDFVVLGAQFAAWYAAPDATADSIRHEATNAVTAIVGEVAGHDDGPLLGACYRAEAYLATWQEQLPFGRPLA